ncbi:hypothetical protein CONPUDRAFT_141578 [Coniophora puteana RWD-64-598 SS2]|uniref:Uncharacterized protein n=1 Tax=Coniophora puteana (strain RWD-64-598) TaxID=741705 RepID=A0A5M3N057_CONPW|nr:uncharacterized protein CONPUDRAFT_141578 [Coniophora puteana RWD-64-598 SS2]EIW84637.1 hypothetical protein CONPUDRAFT_141578 [Coniophora puteana RWD-64-598 SS2]
MDLDPTTPSPLQHQHQHQSTLTPLQSTVHTPSNSSRKRNRENETPAQRLKREKAAERQRRKRERDRNNAQTISMIVLAHDQPPPDPGQLPSPPPHQPHPMTPHAQHPHPPLPHSPMPHSPIPHQQPPHPHSHPHPHPHQHPHGHATPLPPGFVAAPNADEIVKKDKIRAAARERQRKHRQLVKARKMRDMGMEPPPPHHPHMHHHPPPPGHHGPPPPGHPGHQGGEMMPTMEEVAAYQPGQYAMLAHHEMGGPHPHEMMPPGHPHGPPPPGHPGPPPGQHPPNGEGGEQQGYPAQVTGGQSFASTLLLSFSCAPLLKQHLLRTLQMTNDELASLEPIIAEAWDHWDHQRRIHWAQQAAAAAASGVDPGGPGTFAPPNGPHNGAGPGPGTPPQATAPQAQNQTPNPTDYRARFQRPVVAPSPFKSFAVEAAAAAAAANGGGGVMPSSPSASNANLTGSPANAEGGIGGGALVPVGTIPGTGTIDPHLAGVVIAAAGADVTVRQKVTIDPDFGQAKGEAEGVVGRLERP